MPNHNTSQTHPDTVDENKRGLLTGLGALAVATVTGTASVAQELLSCEIPKDTSALVSYTSPSETPEKTEEVVWEYIPSKLGIDYRALAPSPMAELLSQGEVEWMERAEEVFGDERGDIWKNDFLPEVASGAISEYTARDMREFTPNMLRTFAVAIDRNIHPQYSLLQSYGASAVLDQVASL